MSHKEHETASVSPEEMRLALDRVLNSKYFVNAPMKQRFLKLICEFYITGRGADLNEYLIGQEVFDRDNTYTPATDPIVRVSAHGVREKLHLYHQKEGANEEIHIEIPIGSYEPIFFHKAPPQAQTDAAGTFPAPTLVAHPEQPSNLSLDAHSTALSSFWYTRKWVGWVLFGVLAILAGLAGYLFFANRSLREQAEKTAAQIEHFRLADGIAWEPFLQSPEPTLLILSNPSVYRLANAADPDSWIRKGIGLTPEQANVLTSAAGNRLPLAKDGSHRLVPAFNMYTGIGEALGIYRLRGLFHAAGKTTLIKQSRSISPDDLKSYNVILLGSVYSNQWSKPLSIKENFVYTSRSTIENLAPLPGEEREYKAVFHPVTGLLIEDYALITVTPGVSGDKTVMVLAGIFSEGTEAASEFVTNANYLNELNQHLRKLQTPAGKPAYYQALLRVRVNAFPTKTSLVTVRELQTNGQ